MNDANVIYLSLVPGGLTPDEWLIAEIRSAMSEHEKALFSKELRNEHDFHLVALLGLVRMWAPEIRETAEVKNFLAVMESESSEGRSALKNAAEFCNPAEWVRKGESSKRTLRVGIGEPDYPGEEFAIDYLFNQMALSELKHRGQELPEKWAAQNAASDLVSGNKVEFQDCMSLASFVVAQFRPKKEMAIWDQIFVSRVESWVRQYHEGVDISREEFSELVFQTVSERLHKFPGETLEEVARFLRKTEFFAKDRTETFTFQGESEKIRCAATGLNCQPAAMEGWEVSIQGKQYGLGENFQIPSGLTEVMLVDPNGQPHELWWGK